MGPAGIRAEAAARAESATPDQREFYDSVLIVLDASMDFMRRYADLATDMAATADTPERAANLGEVARICTKLSTGAAESFHEAVQSLWFLFVTLLHMESNASSFSPGRADQYLYPTAVDGDAGGSTDGRLGDVEGLLLEFNQIVYLRIFHAARRSLRAFRSASTSRSAAAADGSDDSNDFTYLFLRPRRTCFCRSPICPRASSRNSPESFLTRAPG